MVVIFILLKKEFSLLHRLKSLYYLSVERFARAASHDCRPINKWIIQALGG